MKNTIYLLFFATAFSTAVTFNVNMSEQDVGDEGPTLWMGHLYPDAGFVMTDEDGDNIWSYTLDLEPGTYTYKYRNGWWPDWNTGSGWEDLLGQDCATGQWNDREVVVSDIEEQIVDSVCFSSCTDQCFEIIYSNVTFQVDMSDEELSESDIVYIQGTFNGWCGYCNPMSDVDGDDIWELTLELPVGEHQYLFTTNGWNGLNGGVSIGSSCDYDNSDAFGNYGFLLEEQNLLLGPYCFGTCWDTCQPPVEVDVTFSVDMSGVEIQDAVYMMGDFQFFPWQTSILATEMLDSDGDGIYTTTITLLSDQLVEYKFVNGTEVESDFSLGSCGNNPDSECSVDGPDCNNREFQVPTCQMDDNDNCYLDPLSVDLATFNSCSLVSADVNFFIDLNYSGFPNADYDQCGLNGSWNAEGDQWLGWGLNLEDDNSDGVFTGTLSNLPGGNYEFVVFCSGQADGWSGWGHLMHAPTQSECDFDASDEYGNYGFTVSENTDLNIYYCAGSCEQTCTDNGGNNETYEVSFDVDGVEDCGFVSVTGTWDNWSGWGAHTDNDMTASMPAGSYEYVILCVNTEGEWWNDIWANSTVFNAPSECDVTGEYGNYGLDVSTDMTVSICAGTCNEVCDGNCLADGDVSGDGILNVVDIVGIVGYVLGNSEFSNEQICKADINTDGIINVVDIVAIVGLIVG